MSSGIAIAGAIFTSRQAVYLAQLTTDDPVGLSLDRLSLVSGYQDTMLIGSIVCVLAIFTSFSRGNARPQVATPRMVGRWK
jgi:hypothetical protein